MHATAVRVVNFPAPDLASIHLAQVGIVIGLVALGVAVVTLLRVNRQIQLANDALDQAVKELQATQEALALTRIELEVSQKGLHLTRESNKLVEESLSYSREQNEALSRRAHLYAFSNAQIHGPAPNTPWHHLELYLVNKGLKSAHGCVLQLLFPRNLDFNFMDLHAKLWNQLPSWNGGDAMYSVYEREIKQGIFPNSVVKVVEPLPLNQPGEVLGPMRYRLIYDDGITSDANGSYLELLPRSRTNLDNVVAGLPPS